MTLTRSARLIAFLLFVLVAVSTTPAQEATLVDDYVNKPLRDWEVPGELSLEMVAPNRFSRGRAGRLFRAARVGGRQVKSLTLAQGSGPSFVLTPKQ